MTATNKGIVKSTAILTVSGLVVKILSAAYRIPLTRMLGAEGMGIYSAAFNIFMPFFSLATAGITPTVSRLRATCDADDSLSLIKIKAAATKCFGRVSFILAVLGLVVSKIYSEYIDSPMIFTGVCLLAPNLLLATFEAVYKGISQGSLDMVASAVAGVLESGAKLIVGITSVYLAGCMLVENRGQWQLVCAFATVTVCGFICWVYLHRDFARRYSQKGKSDFKVNGKILFSMAVPVSLSALVVSLANFSDTVICLSIVKNIPEIQLMAAYPFISFSAREEKAIWLFGVYQGLCLSVFNLIPSLSSAVGQSGLPFITRSIHTENKTAVHTQSQKVMKLTGAIVVPVSLFVTFFTGEILITLYGDRGRQTTLATYFLKFMAPVAICAAFCFPLNSILHAVKKSGTILKILLFSCGVKVFLSGWLCAKPQINIMGCVVSVVVFHCMVFVLTVLAVKKVDRDFVIMGHILPPAIISYLLLTFLRIFADFVLYNLPTAFKTVVCGGIFVVVYVTVYAAVELFGNKG